MEEFVQMSLKAYDLLKSNNEYLKRKLKEEQELHSEEVAQAKKEINDLAEKIDQYKKYILECRCRFIDVDNYSLEQYLDIDSWIYGMNYKNELLSLGITKQEMDEFIVDKYEEYVKEKEEDEDDEAFVPCEPIVAWAPFQRIDEEHKEKTDEQMFNDLGYTKPKYKLTQFEYDLLSVHKDYKTYNNIANQTHLFKMREKGYFKNIDTKIPICEILDNCEVIE